MSIEEITYYCPNCGKQQKPLEYKSKNSEHNPNRFYSKFVLKCNCRATSFVRVYSTDGK